MKKIINLITVLLLMLTIITSCTDESKNPLPDFAASQGAFVRFSNDLPAKTVSYSVPEEATFTTEIEDLNGNANSYILTMTASTSFGTRVIENFLTIENFPSNITITAQMIVDALGVTFDDLNFGDNFAFSAIVERNDGLLFYGYAPSYDTDSGIFNGGNTSSNLLDLASYKSAMNFDFTLACPEFTVDDVVGNYEVLNFSFGATFPNTTATREIIAGPGENQFTILGGEYPDYGADDLIVNFDPLTGVASLGQEGLIAFDAAAGAFDTDNVGQVSGLVLPCAGRGKLNLMVDFDIYSGNIHPFNLEKQ